MMPQGFDFDQVSSSALIPTVAPEAHGHERLFLENIEIEKEGYIYIYVSNQSDQNMDVYFDDLKITHEFSDVVAGGDYYPFGLAIEDRQITREKYRYGYQGQFAEKDEVTGWNHFELREYDPVIGRWMASDPAGQHFSPYVGMGNDPINKADTNGAFDDYFDVSNGQYLGTDRKGSAIRLISKSDWDLLSSGGFINPEIGRLTGISSLINGSVNDNIAMQIGNFYASRTGIDVKKLVGSSVGLVDDAAASVGTELQGGKVRMGINKGYFKDFYQDSYNLTNVFAHEGKHYFDVLAGKSYNSDNSDDYWGWEGSATASQVVHKSWIKTTTQWKSYIYNKYGKYTLQSVDQQKYFGVYGVQLSSYYMNRK